MAKRASAAKKVLRFAADASNAELANVTGALDANLRQIETELDVAVSRRGHQFRVEGSSENAQAAIAVIEFFLERARKTQRAISVDDIQLYFVELRGRRDAAYDARHRALRATIQLCHSCTRAVPTCADARRGNATTSKPSSRTTSRSASVRPAPARRIWQSPLPLTRSSATSSSASCLTRPAVEAGERLGFLPGDLAQKVDPYLRPLYDALFDLLGFDKTQRLLERQTIEIAPLAYMRGRTLNQSFVILDEAQNTTREQMKMFLTRIGFGSKAVVTGDVTQMDLPRGTTSGLIEAQHVLAEVRGIAFTYFTAADVVRHPLVGRIVEAYEAAEERAQAAEAARPVAALVADTTRRRAS